MMQRLLGHLLDRQERSLGQSMDWLRALYAASPKGFWLFTRLRGLLRHREALPQAVWAAAHLTAAQVEDCGPCVQIAADEALRAGLTPEEIRAVLAGDDSRLGAELALVRRFVRAVCEHDPESETLRREIHAAWGSKGEVDLALAIIGGRAIPMLKRALGHAVACSAVPVALGTSPLGPDMRQP